MALFEMVLLTLPVVAPTSKKTVPNVMLVPAPLMVQFVTTSFEVSARNRMVEVDAVLLELLIVSELPPVLRPSMVTLFAPLRSTKWPAIVPETVRAPLGLMTIEVYEAEPDPLAFKTALAVSVVSLTTLTVTTPVWVPALIASNASFNVA